MTTNIGYLLPKKVLSMDTGNEVMKAVRTIHSYPSLTQTLIKDAEKQIQQAAMPKRRSKLPGYFYGAVKSRQREEAIGIQ